MGRMTMRGDTGAESDVYKCLVPFVNCRDVEGKCATSCVGANVSGASVLVGNDIRYTAYGIYAYTVNL